MLPPRPVALYLSLLLTLTAAADTPQPRHWAFQPVRRPTVPNVRSVDWPHTPVDNFVLAKVEAANCQPAPRADRKALLRRVYLDLVGLPPSPEEQRDFLADKRPDAFARVVDRLLARPEYGERWARHWLDIVRYADTNGYERDGDKPNAWRYRDYVIDALNKDKPYDRFVLEQLAGDEVPDASAESMIATTFLRLGTWDDEPANARVDRYDQLDDVLGTTATAFLGLTLRCARCHDHKFEPFSQVDYYRMLAVFEPLQRPQQGRADLDRPVGGRAELAACELAHARIEPAKAELNKQLQALDAAVEARLLDGKSDCKTSLPADAVAAFRADPKARTRMQKMLVKSFAAALAKEARAAATVEERGRRQSLEKQLGTLASALPPEPPHAYVWFEAGPKAPVTRVLKRGNPEYPSFEVAPGFPTVLLAGQPSLPTPTDRSTGRRLWLARWLIRPDNPLTARVIVNRVWQYHFGVGLAATPSDFGVMGQAPTHPELLDWLADRFVAEGWSLKALHRLIMLSSTYQMSSAPARPEQLRAEDVRLALFGRWRQHRLEAESVRDCVLAVSGQLNPKRGGPGIYPPLPQAVLAGQSRPGDGWRNSDPPEAARRSVYVFVKRSLALPELELLDAADNNASCDTRPVSTTAPQALTFLNGAFLTEQAGHFADRLRRESGDEPSAQVERAFALALCRAPDRDELQRCVAFLAGQQKRIAADVQKLSAAEVCRRALAALCLVLLNTNEFVYPG